MARVLWSKYLDCLNRRPLLTQMVQTGTLMGMGDVIAQKMFEGDKKWNSTRTIRFMGIGVCFVVRSCCLSST